MTVTEFYLLFVAFVVVASIALVVHGSLKFGLFLLEMRGTGLVPELLEMSDSYTMSLFFLVVAYGFWDAEITDFSEGLGRSDDTWQDERVASEVNQGGVQ